MSKFYKLSVFFALLISIVIYLISFFLGDVKADFKVVKNQIHGTHLIKAIQLTAIQTQAYYSLMRLQKQKLFSDISHDYQQLKESLQRELDYLKVMQIRYPDFQTQKLRQAVKTIKSMLEEGSVSFDSLEVALKFLLTETFTVGGLSTLHYEGEKEIYLLGTVMTHYMPEFTNELEKTRAHILQALTIGSLNSSKRNSMIHSMDLVFLSFEEMLQITEMIGTVSSKSFKMTLIQLKPSLEKMKSITNDISKGKLVSLEALEFYHLSKTVRDATLNVFHENIRLLLHSLTKRSGALENRILYIDLLLLMVFLASVFGLIISFSQAKATSYREKEMGSLLFQSQHAIDNFTLVASFDLSGIITTVNEKLCDMSGYQREELIGERQSLFWDPSMADTVLSDMWTVIETGKTWTGKVTNRTKSGEIFYVDMMVTPIFDYNDQIVEYLSIRVDITNIEIIKAQLATELNISNQNFAEAYHTSRAYQHALDASNIVLRTNIGGEITYVNEQFCEISGFSKKELIGKSIEALRSNENFEVWNNAIKDVNTSKKVWHGRVKNRSRHGNDYYLNSTIVPIKGLYGDIIEYIEVSFDVTELVEKNVALKESQSYILEQKEMLEKQKELYELVFKNTSSSVLLIDISENKFIDCNDQAVELLEYDSKDEVLHLQPWDISPEFQPDGQRSEDKSAKMNALAVKNATHSFEWKHRKKSGTEFWVEVILTPIKLEGKEVLYVVWKDIHDQKLAAVELQEKETLLIQQAKFASMGEMIANIAHQWRQPLNALGLTIQKLEYLYGRDKLDAETFSKGVDKSMNLVNSMSNTINDFREFFLPNKEKEEFLVSEAIENAYNIVEASFSNHNIQYDVDITDKMIAIVGYKNEFSQVVVNLLKNSLDALIERNLENPMIDIKVRQEDQQVSIEFCDNGGGIAQSALDKIFDPYFSTKEEGKGTGIGLYMSKMIIEDHMNGQLNVSNKEDGACFTIML